MRMALAPFARISAVLAAMIAGLVDAAAQDDPNADARAELERSVQEQAGGGPTPTPLAPSMEIVPSTPAPETQMREPRGPDGRTPDDSRRPDIKQPETRGPDITQPETRGPETRGPETRGPETRGPDRNRDGNSDRGGRGGRGRGEEFFRNPDLDYRDRDRNRRPDRDDDRHRRPKPPKYRLPPVIVRPYYPPPPPVIVRPYDPPPSYYYNPPPVWSGPIAADVIWGLFSPDVYDALTFTTRDMHERAFIDALAGPLGQTQSWSTSRVRGDITFFDERYTGKQLCRDFVQTIRTNTWQRTVDGRICLKPGKAWRLVAY